MAMKTTKIKDAEIASMKISSLPSRPTAPTSFGGRGYTATEMKAAFDKLPLYLVEKFNSLIEDIAAEEDSIASAMLTGIGEGHTLAGLFSDVTSGAFAAYLDVLGSPLTERITEIRETLSSLMEAAGSSGESIASALAEVSACRREVSAATAAAAALDAKLDTTLERISESGLDPENLTIDCGTPADIAEASGGEV